MGRRGPPKTPTAVLARRGSWRAKLRGKEPEIKASKRRSPPKGMTKGARYWWIRTHKLLSESGVITTADEGLLERYCVVWDRWKQCEHRIREDGLFATGFDKNGNEFEIEAPWTKTATRLVDQLLRMEAQLGISPASRASVSRNEGPDDDDDLDGFKLTA